MIRGRGRGPRFSQPIARNQAPLPPQFHSWWWNPNRVGVKFAPEEFNKKLAELGDDVKVTWHPLRERWGVFVKAPHIQSKICNGWKLLFLWELGGEYAPPDERLLAKIYDRSGKKWGNLYEYWLKVEQAMEYERNQIAKTRESNVRHAAGEWYDHQLIKNIGSGSKFATYHQG